MEQDKRYNLNVTENQLKLMIQCVEDCHRFASGQMELNNTLAITNVKDANKMKEMLRELKPIMTDGAEYPWDGMGCENDSQRKFIAETYCLYREMLHRLLQLNGKGKSYNVYLSDTLTCEEGGPLPIVEPSEEKKEEKI